MKNIIIFLLGVVLITLLLVALLILIQYLYSAISDVREDLFGAVDGLINKGYYKEKIKSWAYQIVKKDYEKETQKKTSSYDARCLREEILLHEKTEGNIKELNHGEWKQIRPELCGNDYTYSCSKCKRRMPIEIDKHLSEFSYCPYCGARMDKE